MDGLVEAVEYEFRVTSVNRAGAGSSSIVSNAVLAKDPIRELFFFLLLFVSRLCFQANNISLFFFLNF